MQSSSDNRNENVSPIEDIHTTSSSSASDDLCVYIKPNESHKTNSSSQPEEKHTDDENADGEDEEEVIFVPNNPTTWTQKHIEMWLKWASNQFKIKPPLDVSRFPKSGPEMAQFTRADFYIMCGSFEGGKLVADHFKYMMETARECVEPSLLEEGDPSEFF
jgi:ETS-type family